MLYPFVLLSLAATALCCAFSPAVWPQYLWLVPLLFVAFFAAALLLYVIFLLCVCLCVRRKDFPQSRSRFIHFITVYTMGLLVKLARGRVTVEGEEKLPKDGRWLLVGNHISDFDPLTTVWALRRHELAFIAKPSIFKIPVAGPLIFRDFYLPIDRENNREALKTILKAAEYMRGDLSSIGIYPEGTRSHDGRLLPFKNGALKIAQRAKAPVVVTVIEGSDSIARRFPFRSTRVTLSILEVISAEEVAAASTTELGDRIRALMLEKLGQQE